MKIHKHVLLPLCISSIFTGLVVVADLSYFFLLSSTAPKFSSTAILDANYPSKSKSAAAFARNVYEVGATVDETIITISTEGLEEEETTSRVVEAAEKTSDRYNLTIIKIETEVLPPKQYSPKQTIVLGLIAGLLAFVAVGIFRMKETEKNEQD